MIITACEQGDIVTGGGAFELEILTWEVRCWKV